jgi:hypothetical protein
MMISVTQSIPLSCLRYFETVMTTYSRFRRLMNNAVTLTAHIRISFQSAKPNITTDQLNLNNSQPFFRSCKSLCYSKYSSLFMEPEFSLPFERMLAAQKCFLSLMPPHVHIDFVVPPPGCGRSATNFWVWGAHRAQLRCPDYVSDDDMCERGVPGEALNLSSTSYPNHGCCGDLPL